MHQKSTRVSMEEILHFQRGLEWELLNYNMISLSLSSLENKTALSNNQLRPSSSSIDISLISINAPTHGNIDLSLQSFVHLLVYLFLIRLMPNPWAINLTVLISISNRSHDLDKSHLEVAGVSSRFIMFQHIESWLLYFTFFKLWPHMNKINHWIL